MRRTTLIFCSPDRCHKVFYCASTDCFIVRWHYEGIAAGYTELINDCNTAEWLRGALEFCKVDTSTEGRHGTNGLAFWQATDSEFNQWFYHAGRILGLPVPEELLQRWRDRAIEREPAYME